MALIAFYPSKNLIKTIFINPHFTHTHLKAGNAFLLSSNDDYLFQVDDLELTQIQKGKFLGAFSVYKNSQALLTAKSSIIKKTMSHPEIKIATAVLNIETRQLKNPSNIRIPASFFKQIDDSEVEYQRKYLKNILKDETLPSSCFDSQQPIQSVLISKFGSYRRLPTGKEYFHTGVDLRAPEGTDLYTMAQGQVRVARSFILAGNAVILEHGYGVFSKYYHMSKIHVQEGQILSKGDFIGKSGGTGRVEAPHLHWEVSWKGISIDPTEFIQLWKTVCS